MTDDMLSVRELEEKELAEVAPYGLRSAERRASLGNRFRRWTEPTELEYRTEYHRDRDRIIWSTAFRRLQHKTQIFPHYVADPFRRRLTHSLEVAQIATTLARAFRLNQTATEAIALAHDIGHTPFGHGGEDALNRRLVALVKPSDWLDNWDGSVRSIPASVRNQILSTAVPVYGFDHCVQGIEQVSRISEEYSPTYYWGLNLTFDVRDGILKHIFDRPPEEAEKELLFHSSLENVMQLSDYVEFGRNSGSLEAQCVWFADKVGYLLGDMEDSVRSHIVSYKQLSESNLVRLLDEEYGKRRGTPSNPIETHRDFLAFQRRALAVLILDCVEVTAARLREVSPGSVDAVLEIDQRLVDVGEGIRTVWNAHYKEFLHKLIYRHADVRACCFKAKTIVEDLFTAHFKDLDLVPEAFRDRTKNAYQDILGPEEIRVMCVRNYIAGMTDSYATAQHKRLYMSSEPAGSL